MRISFRKAAFVKATGVAPRIIPLLSVVFALFALTACGGGASVNNPPGADSVGLISPQHHTEPFTSIGYRMRTTPPGTPIAFEVFPATYSSGQISGSADGTITARSTHFTSADIDGNAFQYMDLGVWAEGEIPATGILGATFTTGAFFIPRNDATIASVRDIMSGRLGAGNTFSWNGRYTAYVHDVRGAGMSRIEGDTSINMRRSVYRRGGDTHSIEIRLSPPSASLSTFSPGFAGGSPTAAQIDQEVRLTTVIAGSGANGTGTFRLSPVTRVRQLSHLPSGATPLFPTRYLPSDTYAAGAFFGGASDSEFAREVGGVYRFDILVDKYSNVRTVGAFGARRD